MAKRREYTDDFVNIKNQSDISKIEKACRIVAETFNTIKPLMRPGISTLEIDAVAEDYIRSKNARPAFKGYEVEGKFFPGTLCISINEEVVHGIPSDRILKEGDIVSVDCGAELDGYFGDSAVTYGIGQISPENEKLMQVTNESLFKGIEQAVAGNKLYDISKAIQDHCESNGYSLTRELVGHGIGRNLHEEPPVPNFVPPLLYRSRYPNIKLRNGIALAIEPMVHRGKKEIRSLQDGWTIVTADKSTAAHFEHTIIIQNDKALILTLRD